MGLKSIAKRLILSVDLDQVGAEYVETKKQIAALEERLDKLSPILKEHLRLQPEMRATLGGLAFSLSQHTQECFQLKKALEKLGRKTLKAFITTSDVEKIHVSYKSAA